MGVPGLKIEIPTNPNGSINPKGFLKVVSNAKKNFSQKSKIMQANENPAVANILKLELDSKTYLQQFCELNKTFLSLNKEHNLDYNNCSSK